MQNRKGTSNIVIVILFLALLIQPSAASQVNTNGIEIEHTDYNYLKQNTSFQFEFTTTNASNGFLLDNTRVGCTFDLFNATGGRILNTAPTYNAFNKWVVIISETNTSIQDTYSYVIYCNDTYSGGFVNNNYLVTIAGKAPPSDNLLIFIFVAIMAILSAMMFLLFYTIEKGILIEMDLKLISLNLAAYFALFVLLFLNNTYIGDSLVSTILNMFIGVGALTNVIIPLTLFVLNYFKMLKEVADK